MFSRALSQLEASRFCETHQLRGYDQMLQAIERKRLNIRLESLGLACFVLKNWSLLETKYQPNTKTNQRTAMTLPLLKLLLRPPTDPCFILLPPFRRQKASLFRRWGRNLLSPGWAFPRCKQRELVVLRSSELGEFFLGYIVRLHLKHFKSKNSYL